VVGTATFALVAGVVLAFFVPPVLAIAVALVAAAAEAISWRIDDNPTVPIAAAGALWLIGG
jgi:dolichol kinase